MKSAARVVAFWATWMICLLPATALSAYDPSVGGPPDANFWEPGPRLRIGISGLLGFNTFINGGYDQGFAIPGAAGVAGFGLSFVVGEQWTEFISTELEFDGMGAAGEEARVAALVSFTPVNFFSVGLGPAVGVNFNQECKSNFGFGASFEQPPGPCGDYSAGYLAGEARLDFLPGGSPGAYGPRRSFDIALEVVVGTSLVPPPQSVQSFGVGVNLLLGYLWY